MSTSYSFGIGLGYEFKWDDVVKALGRTYEEEFRMEDRFDSRTGQKIGQEKVVIKGAVTTLLLNGEEHEEDFLDFSVTLASAVGASCYQCNDCDDDGAIFLVGPTMPDEIEEGMDFGRVECDGAMPFGPFLEMGPELERISKALRALGLDPGKPVIRTTWSVG